MYCVSGGTSEEEKEIGGSAGGGKGRPVGNGHSSRYCAHLQYSKGSAALHLGEFEPISLLLSYTSIGETVVIGIKSK